MELIVDAAGRIQHPKFIDASDLRILAWIESCIHWLPQVVVFLLRIAAHYQSRISRMNTVTDKQSKKLIATRVDPSSGLTTVLADFRKSILQNHESILMRFGQVGALQIETGNWLRIAKNLVPHGQFERWFEEQFGDSITLRTGQRYMKASRTAEEKMDELRARLTVLRSDLDVSNLKDDEVIRELPASELFEIVSMKDDSPKKITSKTSEPTKRSTITPEFLQAMLSFVGPPKLVLSSLGLTNDNFDATEIVVAKDPIDGRDSWPQTAIVFLDSAKACKSLSKIKEAFDKGDLKECLVLLPATAANGESMQDFPHLAFNRVSPLNAKGSSSSSGALVLVLVSESERTTDFAVAFAEFGVVKVPFKVKAK